MTPADLIPAPDAIPVHWGWLELFLLATFIIHILLMNAVVGGSLIGLVRSIFRKQDEQSRAVSLTVGKRLPTILALTVNFGVAPLLFIQMLYGQFLYTSSVLMAAYWLSIVFLLIIAYYGLYIFAYKAERWIGARWVLAMSLALMVCISFFFSNNMTLMLSPERWMAYFDQPGGTILNTGDTSFFPRWMHFLTAAFAVGGLFQAGLYRYLVAKGSVSEQQAAGPVKNGMVIFTGFTLVQLVVGPLFLHSLPHTVRAMFLGGSSLHTGALLIALTGVAVLLHYSVRMRVWPTVGALVFTVSAMSILRAFVRDAYLSPYFSPSSVPQNTEYSPMVMFLLSLLLGGGLIVYMLRLVSRNEPANTGKEG